MESYFRHHCIPIDTQNDSLPLHASGLNNQNVKTRKMKVPCEHVFLQEPAYANGASRVLLRSIISMIIECKYAQAILLFTLDAPVDIKNDKLHHYNLAHELSLLRSNLSQGSSSLFIPTIQSHITKFLDTNSISVKRDNVSTRPVVIIVDALHILIQMEFLCDVQNMFKHLRNKYEIGCILSRVNTSALPNPCMMQQLNQSATVILRVETSNSLLHYPILATERKRSVPPLFGGLVIMLHQLKSGKSRQHVEYFQEQKATDQLKMGILKFVLATDASCMTKKSGDAHGSKSLVNETANLASQFPLSSFNLNINENEMKAKKQAELPYQQKQHGDSSKNVEQQENSSLFYIEEDDPDWDDDDLDDDLDI